MKKIKVFLDDIRTPKECLSYMHHRIGALNPIYDEDWFVVKNYDQFLNVICHNADVITHVSFDHDLADEHYQPEMYHGLEVYNKFYSQFKEKTGLDCAIFLKKFYEERGLKLPVIFVHSMNPAGTKNILNIFNNG
jgi:hypothetical protein